VVGEPVARDAVLPPVALVVEEAELARPAEPAEWARSVEAVAGPRAVPAEPELVEPPPAGLDPEPPLAPV
jgi:hypothetical protein